MHTWVWLLLIYLFPFLKKIDKKSKNSWCTAILHKYKFQLETNNHSLLKLNIIELCYILVGLEWRVENSENEILIGERKIVHVRFHSFFRCSLRFQLLVFLWRLTEKSFGWGLIFQLISGILDRQSCQLTNCW